MNEQYDDMEELNAPEMDRNARPWLELIGSAKKCFDVWQEKADSIDKVYADLEVLANTNREREFQIFWANLEVLKPSIYSRPPIPVVMPRFKDYKELPRKASELLERSLITSFETEDIDSIMRLLRDDLAMNGRGVPWLRYDAEQGEDGKLAESVRYEHLDRRDFRHDPARKWNEVEWVARGVWLTRKQGMDRFGDEFLQADFKQTETDKDKEYKGEAKAQVWEIWHKSERKVVWVAENLDDVLDVSEPMLDLEGFFPCPRPAYGTLQRRTLVPVPDYLYYKDQIEEINELTARISGLAESLRMKGFYAAGSEDLSEAIETAIKQTENNAILIPVSNFAALGGSSLKDAVIWLPVAEVAVTVQNLIALRKEIIEDVYQITGLSDIMRGATDANETLGAQELKSQYGSIRIRDRQGELVRIARDMTRMAAEIMAEEFQPDTLLSMSQIDDLPREEQIAQQVQQIKNQAAQAAQNPEIVAQAQANPQQAQQIVQQVQQKISELQNAVTVEKVMALLKQERVRPFVLEIETDSTIQPDENAAKQRATEYVTAVGSFIQNAGPMVVQMPQTGPYVAETLKFVASQYRAGREMEAVIEEFADTIKSMAGQQKPDPGAEQAKAQQMEKQAELAMKKQELDLKKQEAMEKRQADMEERQLESDMKIKEFNAASQDRAEKAAADLRLIDANIEKIRAEIDRINAQAAAAAQPRPEAA